MDSAKARAIRSAIVVGLEPLGRLDPNARFAARAELVRNAVGEAGASIAKLLTKAEVKLGNVGRPMGTEKLCAGVDRSLITEKVLNVNRANGLAGQFGPKGSAQEISNVRLQALRLAARKLNDGRKAIGAINSETREKNEHLGALKHEGMVKNGEFEAIEFDSEALEIGVGTLASSVTDVLHGLGWRG